LGGEEDSPLLADGLLSEIMPAKIACYLFGIQIKKAAQFDPYAVTIARYNP
jgi:hypothetical protein